jgi:D-alanyl-lipoteichoic acid acyltransferase DltB (MBOAT superfamily)
MEFWRCWHVSLSTWIRLHLYTPISIQVWRRLRSRRAIGPATLAIAVLVMVTVGLWHEISLRFLAFGVIHGAAIGVWYMVLGEKGKLHGVTLVLSWAIFQLLLMLSLILFRSSDWSAMQSMILRMFGNASGEDVDVIVPGLAIATLTVFLLQWIELRATRKRVAEWLRLARHSVPIFPLAVIVICATIFFKGMSIEGVWISPHDPYFYSQNLPFIYAQF